MIMGLLADLYLVSITDLQQKIFQKSAHLLQDGSHLLQQALMFWLDYNVIKMTFLERSSKPDQDNHNSSLHFA